jgi:hypothetical protein
MTRQAEGAGERGQSIGIIVNEEEMSFARQALVLLWSLVSYQVPQNIVSRSKRKSGVKPPHSKKASVAIFCEIH